jgi:hypothetical protein
MRAHCSGSQILRGVASSVADYSGEAKCPHFGFAARFPRLGPGPHLPGNNISVSMSETVRARMQPLSVAPIDAVNRFSRPSGRRSVATIDTVSRNR